MKRSRVILFTCILLCFFVPSLFAGSISEIHKYAWSDNVGYINFSNVIVDSDRLSGFAWSKNSGWINLDPAQSGVANDGSGNLSGYAWGEHLGWIDFGEVTIDMSTGKFSGIAAGTLIGILTFDCPEYCDVRTDWRPVSLQGGSGGSGGSSSLVSSSPPIKIGETTPKGFISDFIVFIQKTFFQGKRMKSVTRIETVLLALKFQNIPIYKNYSCMGFYSDTIGTMIPWYTCQVAEKARMAHLISSTNIQFKPLNSVSRIEAYSIMMKSICVHPLTTVPNWKQEVTKKAIELGFTVRTLESFEPERNLIISEIQTLVQVFSVYDQKNSKCNQKKD